ncbi:hypothetical protein TNCV_2631661 [Trichonephila clavipes]|nr:hypothetical protein TNCV_2631661 [Trichonephila clavipes]
MVTKSTHIVAKMPKMVPTWLYLINFAVSIEWLSEGGNFNVVLFSYSRAFGDGPSNFELWSSDEVDTKPGTPSTNNLTIPTGGHLSSHHI